MDIYQTRKTNALELQAQAGGPFAFAQKIGREPTYTSQLLGENAAKQIGFKMARHIEAAFGKPDHWLDREHHNDLPDDELKEMIEIYSRLTKQDRESAFRWLRALAADTVDKK